MESHYLAPLIGFLILSIQTGFIDAESEEIKINTDFIDKTNRFALNVYKSLVSKQENIFFSPLSISFSLAMTSLGAKENTLKEMLATLKMNSFKIDDVHSGFQQLKDSIINDEALKEYSLYLASRLFGEDSYKFKDELILKMDKHYNAILEPRDFKGNPETSRKYINDWVSTNTNDKIQNLLGPDTVDAKTKLVLVNAIYFKGDWLSMFTKSKTKHSEFKVTENEIVNVDFMHSKLNVSYEDILELESEVLVLPYKGEHLSMVIILPFLEETTLAKVEQALTPKIIKSFSSKRTNCEVWLPKFKLESSFNLKDTLQHMGMIDLFQEGKADFSDLSASNDLYVSSVVHKAFIEVNEEGTEAAAATGVEATSRSVTPTFKADHPFIFFIKDNSNNSIIFLGRFMRP